MKSVWVMIVAAVQHAILMESVTKEIRNGVVAVIGQMQIIAIIV